METRNVNVTLEKAKEWYKKGGDLKEVALQAFTEEELKGIYFKCITTMNDVISVLNIDDREYCNTIAHIGKSKASLAVFKLSLVKKALNMGKEMNLTKGTIWYPSNPFVTEESSYYKDEIRNGEIEIVSKFSVDCKNYLLLSGYTNSSSNAGLGNFDSYNGMGLANATFGLLGCATKEIAQHIGKYFAKLIFEAKYGDTVDYKWLS